MSQRPKFNFFRIEYVYVAYQIKGNDAYINMVANSFPISPLLGLGDGVKGQKFNFFRTWSCCIQMKGNDECSNMQAHILSLHTQSTPGVGSKVKLFFESTHVAYQINWNGA